MSRHSASGEISVQSLLQSAKVLPRQPDAVRARVLARARLTAAAPLVPVTSVPAARPTFTTPGVAVAAGAVVVGGIVGTVLAREGGWSAKESQQVAPSPAVADGRVAPTRPAPSALVPPPVAAEAGAVSSTQRPVSAGQPRAHAVPSKPRREDAQESYAAELELMRNAHTAYAAHDYTSALVLVGEHARRFAGGLLTEEREALRVRCLLAAGRKNQARLAADAFASRFPRSVLLRRLQAEVGSTND